MTKKETVLQIFIDNYKRSQLYDGMLPTNSKELDFENNMEVIYQLIVDGKVERRECEGGAYQLTKSERDKISLPDSKQHSTDSLRDSAEQFLKFNLNDYILVQITDYGWEQLEKHEREINNIGFTEHCIKSRKVVVNGKDYYKLQAHFVISTFGDMAWASSPAPLTPEILVPEISDNKKEMAKIQSLLNQQKETEVTDSAEGLHTPGELFLTDIGTMGEYTIFARPAPGDGGDIICEAPEAWQDSMKRWRANAERIVKCWNEYDQLKQENESLKEDVRECVKIFQKILDSGAKLYDIKFEVLDILNKHTKP